MSDDADLLQRYASDRSEAAFSELVQRHLNLVYRAALRRLGNDAHGAQDVSQLVFTLLAQKARSLRRHPNLAGWLYSATQNIAREVNRKNRRRSFREEEAHKMNSPSLEAEIAVDMERLRPVLDSALDDLGSPDRDAILLRFLEDRSFAEVGAALRVSEDAARMRVTRALGALRASLMKRGVTSPAAALATALVTEGALAAPAGLSGLVTGTALAEGAAVATGLGALLLAGAAKVLAVTSIVAALGASGLAAFALRGAYVAHQGLAQEERQLESVHARLRSAAGESQSGATPEFANFLESVAALRTAADAREAETQDRVAEGKAAEAAGRSLLAAHPELKEPMLEDIKRNVAGNNFLLYRELGLTEEQQAQLEDIVANGPHGWKPVSYSEGSIDLGPDGKLVVGEETKREAWLRPGANISPEETSRRLRVLLGPEGYTKYESSEFWTERPDYFEDRTLDLAEALSYTDTPLSAEQARKMNALNYAEFDHEARPQEPDLSFLSEKQRAVLELFQARDAYQRMVYDLTGRIVGPGR